METIGRDLNEMQRVPLAESHVAALRAAGTLGKAEGEVKSSSFVVMVVVP
jgi:hypothetical protein